MPVYPGALPGTLDSQANWRLETRIHGFTSSLATGMSVLAQLGGFRLYLYRFNSQPSYTYGVYINSAAVFLDSTYTDIFIRAQRIGTNYTVKVWKVAADGTMIDAGSSSGGWPGYSLAPEISVGANTDTDVGIFGGRFPFNGSQSFFRFFTANADDSVTPNACDTSAAYIRYEFEGTLANTGNGSASLAPTGTIGYQLSPASSCAAGGAPPAFSLVAGAQNPDFLPQGAAASYPLSINRQNFSGLVSLSSCTGPAGVTCTLPGTTGTSANVSVGTTAATPVGNYTVVLTASGPGVANASVNLPLAVISSSPPPPTFTLQVAPAQVMFSPNGTQNLTATLFPGNGFTGNVNFACAAAPGNTVPSGVTCVAPNPASNVQTQRSFTITAAAGVAQGTYNLRLTGTGPQAQTAYAAIQVSITASSVRAFIYPDYREISTSPAAYYQFQSAVENSSNSQVNWSLSPVSGGLTLSSPPSGTGTATAGLASYVFFRPPSSLPGGATTQYVILSGAPAAGGVTGNATLLLRNDPYAPPIVCVLGSTAPPCVNETNLPGTLSSSFLSYLNLESHYTGSYGSIASGGRLHRTMRVSFALNPETPWDAGPTSCLLRVERSLGYGSPDGQTLYLEGGTQTAAAALGTGLTGTITNGVCTVGLQYTNMSTNFSADPSKAWLTLYLRFNAASAPRYIYYKVESFNSTSSGTVLMKNTPLPVTP